MNESPQPSITIKPLNETSPRQEAREGREGGKEGEGPIHPPTHAPWERGGWSRWP